MRPAERITIYAALAIAVALALGIRDPQAVATRAQSQVVDSIATVDVFTLVDEMLRQPEYRSLLEARTEELNAQIGTAQQRVQALQVELSLMTPQDVNAQAKYQEFQQAQAELQALGQQANTEYMAMSSGQVADTYERVYQAANAVAERQGIAYLMATMPNGEIEENERAQAAVVIQNILARPLLRGHAINNITDLVRDELGLPDPSTLEEEADEGDANPGDAEAAPGDG